jgi:3-oxoacyl-(acyl-carrier-protein) synthase
MSTNLISKNLMGTTIGAAFVVALIVCLLSIRKKLDFGLLVAYEMY